MLIFMGTGRALTVTISPLTGKTGIRIPISFKRRGLRTPPASTTVLAETVPCAVRTPVTFPFFATNPVTRARSEEHTSELQSRQYLVCRLLLEKKKIPITRLQASVRIRDYSLLR